MRLGLGYIKGAAKAEVRALVAERERGGPFAGLGELAARVACSARDARAAGLVGRLRLPDRPVRPRPAQPSERRVPAPGHRARRPEGAARRTALWQLGMAAPAGIVGGEDGGQATQLALPLELAAAPRLRRLGRWQRLIADYSTSGVTVGEHAMAILRERLTVPMLATSAQLRPPAQRLPGGGGRAGDRQAAAGDGQGDDVPAVRGRVRHDQPDRAQGGLRAPPPLARAEPLLLARGRLERSQGVVNVIVRELRARSNAISSDGARGRAGGAGERTGASPARSGPVEQGERAGASEEEEAPGAEVGSSMRAVAASHAELRHGQEAVGASVIPPASSLPRIARLGSTDLEVFPLCLGGNVFGWTLDEERSFAVLDAYFQAGGNFIDTADTYGRRGPGGAGESERIIGRWMAARGNREKLVIATKVGMSPELGARPRRRSGAAIEGSLERLGIEHAWTSTTPTGTTPTRRSRRRSAPSAS